MQNPTSRRFDHEELWGDSYDWFDHECHVSGDNFVRGRCECCQICDCPKGEHEVMLVSCHDDVCYDCDLPRNHGNAIIIATDGACRNNGRAIATAGCGVFFSIDSVHNKCFQLQEARPTSQRAELHAAIYALKKVRNMFANGGFAYEGNISEVIIKTDSAYVVNSMTKWISKWRNNGYTNARGLPLVNQDLIQQLDSLCNRLDDLDVQARFWKVPRGWNMQADKLANAALNGSDWRNFDEDDYFEGDEKPYIH